MEKEVGQRNEVIAILNNMRLKHLSVNIKEKDRKFNLNGFITKADTTSIVLFYEKIPDIVPLKNIRVCFDYNRNFYTSSDTTIRVVNVPLKSVEVIIPEKFFYHPVRKHARVDISDSIQLSIRRIETPVKETTSNINVDELPATLRNIYLELKGETPDLKKIIGMIGDELSRYSNRFRINLFKDNMTLTPIEKVVNQFKKTFWIGDTDNLNNYIHLGDKYSIIGYEKYFEMIKKTMSPDILEQIRHNYISRGITSYAMVPIIVGDRVVGVIEVSVPEDQKYKKLTIYEIFYIKGLADILGEVVVKSHKESQNDETNLDISDISIGGLLAETKNVYLPHSVKENAIVILGLKLAEMDIEARARLVRYNYIPGENAGLNVAFEFLFESDAKKMDVENLIKRYLKINLEKQKK